MKQTIEQLSTEGAAADDTAAISSVLVRDSQGDADIARCVFFFWNDGMADEWLMVAVQSRSILFAKPVSNSVPNIHLIPHFV